MRSGLKHPSPRTIVRMTKKQLQFLPGSSNKKSLLGKISRKATSAIVRHMRRPDDDIGDA